MSKPKLDARFPTGQDERHTDLGLGRGSEEGKVRAIESPGFVADVELSTCLQVG